jgi:hypothetical protein
VVDVGDHASQARAELRDALGIVQLLYPTADLQRLAVQLLVI